MDRFPKTSVTEENFFLTVSDLEVYVNGFYGNEGLYLRNNYENEHFSDNVASVNSPSIEYTMLRGNYSKSVATGWDDWGTLRSVNFMLVNVGKATGNEDDIRHWTGVARYFRAVFYINKIRLYSDVPWYNKPLSPDDPDIYKASDPRTLIADSIVADLEYASANIKPDLKNRTTINKFVALTILSRFCLYEGTYRKYHEELNLSSSADIFLEKAANAALEIMNSSNPKFNVTGNGRKGFSDLFTSADLSANAEIILMGEYTSGKGDGNSSYHMLYGDYALSRSLMETFLMADGSRFTDQPDYDSKPFKEVFVNRDPRFAETFVEPGFTKPLAGATPYVITIRHGGYEPIKYYPRDSENLGGNTWRQQWTDLPVLRFAEALLNFAEAKAELGSLEQSDLDISVNPIRRRVSMPDLNITTANANPDPALAAQYPNVNGANKGVILEIRRERRVELALEGQRLDDINRWAAGKLLAEAPQGMYIPKLGAYDVNGDDVPDFAILASPDKTDPIDHLPPAQKERITKYYLSEEGDFYLSKGDSGYIMFTSDKNAPRSFVSPKYYYRPIPATQQTINPNLKQVFGWE
jgi:hypothetical protein